MRTLILAVVLSGLTAVNTAFGYAPFGMPFAERLQSAQERSFSLIEGNHLIAKPAQDFTALLWTEVRLSVDTLHDACLEVAARAAYREDSYWFCLDYIRHVARSDHVATISATTPAD